MLNKPLSHKADNPRILLGMSGGVDSSTAVYLLQENGFDVKGLTLSLTCSMASLFGDTIHPRDHAERAKRVCDFFGIPHETLERCTLFEERVVNPFVREYFSGRTPNPCVECNRFVKWDELLKKADEERIPYVATGHYARVRYNESTRRYELLKGKDPKKDQSYYLWQLTQEQLARTRFPLGDLTKDRIKIIASELGLESANTGESQDICFIPGDDYREFLREYVPDQYQSVGTGYFLTQDGNIVGEHPGFFHFTIGQRRGLHLALGYPVYVLEIHPESNEVVVGSKEALIRSQTAVSRVNWVSIPAPEKPIEALVKIRYRHKGLRALLNPLSHDKIFIKFIDISEAVTPGQSAVFYHGDRVLGGGIIEGA
ncbi:MAG: tRNA(5-methylaminomethyl-2-thiouridylate)-methyl transferase [Marinimicrobia bacterium 46_43]|nr:MAG: tRNA(5-methylaminomethyl-2-thiouridylate)-methyl transferase [Marinimicrobia bacterium 46_43]